MRGRPTIDRKGKRINLRINDTTYKKLYTIAENCGITVAEYVRSMIDGENQKPGNAGVPLKTEKRTPQNAEMCTPKDGMGTPFNDGFMELSKDLRMSYDDLYTEIKRLTDTGELMKEGTHLVVHERNVDPKGIS